MKSDGFGGLVVRTMLGALLAGPLLTGGCPALPPDDASGDDATTEDMLVENSDPVADAGSDQTVTAGETVVLDGSASSDADGDALFFVWRQTGGSVEVTLEDAFSSRPRFVSSADVTAETRLTFRLTVVDGFAADFDDVRVTISPAQ